MVLHKPIFQVKESPPSFPNEKKQKSMVNINKNYDLNLKSGQNKDSLDYYSINNIILSEGSITDNSKLSPLSEDSKEEDKIKVLQK